MILELNRIDVDCIIGDRPDERERMQRLTVDVRLELGDAVAASDDLLDTVDYAALTERIRVALAAAKCRMIERAAKIVCDLCMEDVKVCAARVKVTKTGAIAHLGSASATVMADRPQNGPNVV